MNLPARDGSAVRCALAMLALAGCRTSPRRDMSGGQAAGPPSATGESTSKGPNMPPLGPVGRNALVSVAAEPGTPELGGEGVAIVIRGANPGTTARGVVGDEIRLLGRAVAGDALSRRCGASPLMGVFVTVIRTDEPWGATLPVRQPVAMSLPATPPPDDDPTQPHRRTPVTFAFDLQRFFDLPAEPGTYSVRAHLGPYDSARLSLEVVRRDR